MTGPGGGEPGRGAPDADQDQEDGGVHDRAAGPDVGEDRHVHPGAVAAVSEAGGEDLEHRRAALLRFGLLGSGLAYRPGGAVPGGCGRRWRPRVTAPKITLA